jgi:hypothetical protein
MANALDVIPWIIVIGIIPYLIPVLMPTWRTFGICVLIIGGVLAKLWIQHIIDTRSPGYKEHLADAIGLAMFTLGALSFVAGIATRIVSLAVTSARGSFVRAFAINTAGFSIFVALLATPHILHTWRVRPPIEACAKAVFSLVMAQGHLRVPASPLFNIYLGPAAGAHTYYLGTPSSLRELCSLTGDGARTVRATNLWLAFDRNLARYPLTCDAAPFGDVKSCAAWPAIRSGHIDATDYPLGAHAFSPDEVRMGNFGASRSTYDDSLGGTDARAAYFRSERRTPDGKPLAFACMGETQALYCRASYGWRDGIHLDFEFHADRAEVVDKGERVDAVTRNLFERMVARGN